MHSSGKQNNQDRRVIAVSTRSHLSGEIKRLAHEAGFDLAGIASAADTPEHAFFPQWIANGTAGEMRYLEARNDAGKLKRSSLSSAAPWARSVVVCALHYNTDQPYSTHAGTTTQGWISRYAWTQRDYHDVLFAKYAGVGWIGKNTCILNEDLGSWLFLGVMLMSVELTPDMPPPDRCGSCTRCLDACPTNAFPAPYQLDATKCVSYLTIEKRGAIPEGLRTGIGRQIFGCDICQDVCPWNRKAPFTKTPGFEARPGLVNPELDWLAQLSIDQFREVFRGTAVKRAKHSGLLRNVAIAMGNSGEERFSPILEQLTRSNDPTVKEAAEWALRAIGDRLRMDSDQVP